MFQIVAVNLITLCLLIAMGFIAGRSGIIDDKLSAGLGDVLLKIALPCTIVTSMQQPFTGELLRVGGLVFACSAGVMAASGALGWLLCKLMGVKAPAANLWMFVAAFPNVGYMGFPVIGAVYGGDALFYVSMVNASFNLLSTTIGLAVISGGPAGLKPNFRREKRPRKPFREWNLLPGATVIGLALFLLSAELPAPLADAMGRAGGMTTPLSMIIVGALLSKSKGLLGGRREWAVLALRLIILPVLTYFALAPFISDANALGVLVLLSGMPAATVTAIYAARFTTEGVSASRIVAVSTVLSLATLPCVALLL